MNHCFHCGGQLTQTRSLNPTTQRFRCDRCRRGYLLSHTGNCVFFSKTMPKDSDETTTAVIGGQGGSRAQVLPKAEFDFGFSDIDLGF